MDKTVNVLTADLQVDFAGIMPDDSMKDRGIQPGDVIYLEACDHVDNGQTAAVRVGEEILVRIIWQEETRLFLAPANPAYMNTVLQGAEMDSAEIIGRVVAYAHVYK